MLLDLFIHLRAFVVRFLIRIQEILHPIKSGQALQWKIIQRTKDPIGRVEDVNFVSFFHRKIPAETILGPHNIVAEFSHDKVTILHCHGNPYDMEKHPFFYNGIFQEAEYKVTVKLQDFNGLLDETPWPDLKVIWLWSVGRCGSTLLGNLFTSLDGFRTISEPTDIFMISKLKHRLSEADYRRTLDNSLKYHLIQVKNRWPETKFVVIKTRNLGFWYITKSPEEISENIFHIFLYRDVYPVLRSYFAASNALPKLGAHSLVGRMLNVDWLWEEMTQPLIDTFRSHPELKDLESRISLRKFAHCHIFAKYGITGLLYLHALYRQMTKQIPSERLFAVKYERLNLDPISQFEQIASTMGDVFSLDENTKEKLTEISKQDSQKNSALSRESVKRRKTDPVPEQIMVQFEAEMTRSGQEEDLKPDFLLPNTI